MSPTTQYPDRVNAHLFLYVGTSTTPSYTCSGAFIGPNVVLTAAHCLYSVYDYGGWIGNVAVVPVEDGAGYYPYGYQFGNWFHVNAGWWGGLTTPDWDWGVVSLPDTTLGGQTGYYTLSALQTSSLLSTSFYPITEGYPGDKPAGTMWAGWTSSFYEIYPTKLTYFIYAYYGQSGSAVRRYSDNRLVTTVAQGILGVITEGPRVDQYVVNDVIGFCNLYGCAASTYVEPPPVLMRVYLPMVQR